eukprot:CAMPEP_0118876666 /NCGR_PEP_ID=MMETSP1163-20130328/17266_1 /TAXON_ID=124430 /ORGANISM="Phaeomonas parva, Strain CCMP2877" /LENGTH=149 /DNA_ID=CAMNT_0006812293 /DNA_START=175 /DNA_END=624 /DNA_ORIENTATION=+
MCRHPLLRLRKVAVELKQSRRAAVSLRGRSHRKHVPSAEAICTVKAAECAASLGVSCEYADVVGTARREAAERRARRRSGDEGAAAVVAGEVRALVVLHLVGCDRVAAGRLGIRTAKRRGAVVGICCKSSARDAVVGHARPLPADIDGP